MCTWGSVFWDFFFFMTSGSAIHGWSSLLNGVEEKGEEKCESSVSQKRGL